MAKKLKLKSVKKIKDSIQEETSHMRKRKKKKSQKKNIGNFLLMGFITCGIVVASFVIAFSLYIVFTSPEFTQEKLYFQESSIIEWADGTEMTKLGKENRVLKNYEDLPQVLVDALVATEDSRFFQHSGFDAARFLKASIGQALGQSGAGGASTITMQLVKNYFTNNNAHGIQGIIRKFTDIYMAVFKLEKKYTKEQIIEMYFNTGWFAGGGSNYTSIDGVEQACQYFFGKSVSDISLPEAAMIVGMYNSPVEFNPYDYPENSNDRKNTVLALMNRHGYITEEEMKDAQSIHVSTLVKDQDNTASSFVYQNLVDIIRDQLQEKGIDISRGGYRVRTTFDKNIQDVILRLENGEANAFKDELVQVGIAVTSVADGSVKGLGSGRNYVARGTERATSVRRQPGSTIKPLIDYGPLIEYNNATTGQMFIDFRYPYNAGGTMNNWDNTYKGAMTLKDALSASRNVTALEAFHQVAPENIKDFLSKVSIDESNYGEQGIFESHAVGGFRYGLSPVESSAAYATFARGGYFIEPYYYTSVTNMVTEETIEYKPERTRAMSEETAYMITDVLLQATSEGVGGPINSNLRGSIASKSGTSNIDSASAESIGVSPYATPDHWVNTYNTDYAISMWMGYDTLDKNHYFTTPTGSTPRGKLSAFLANNILNSNQKFEKPSSVTTVTVERNTLPTKRASEYTPDNMKYSALFKAGTEPSDTSNRFAKLSDPSHGDAEVSGRTITLTWNEASTPLALDTAAVRSEFANYFKTYQQHYSRSYAMFEEEYMRLYEEYNASSLGKFGYQIYLKDSNDNLTSLGWTDKTYFTYSASSGGSYEFVVASAYSIFKANRSNGISIEAYVSSTEGNSLNVTTNKVCVEVGKSFNPKDGVTVTMGGVDITNFATIVASNVDTSSSGEKNVTYSVTYHGETVRVNGKVNVSNQCTT